MGVPRSGNCRWEDLPAEALAQNREPRRGAHLGSAVAGATADRPMLRGPDMPDLRAIPEAHARSGTLRFRDPRISGISGPLADVTNDLRPPPARAPRAAAPRALNLRPPAPQAPALACSRSRANGRAFGSTPQPRRGSPRASPQPARSRSALRASQPPVPSTCASP